MLSNLSPSHNVYKLQSVTCNNNVAYMRNKLQNDYRSIKLVAHIFLEIQEGVLYPLNIVGGRVPDLCVIEKGKRHTLSLINHCFNYCKYATIYMYIRIPHSGNFRGAKCSDF